MKNTTRLSIILISVILFLVYTSFTSYPRFLVEGEVIYLNIDQDQDSIPLLKFDIQIKDRKEKKSKRRVEKPYIAGIEIIKNDSLICTLLNKEKNEFTQWVYPTIPEGFEIIYPENTLELPLLTKNDDFTIEIVSNYTFYSWKHQSNFSDKSSRWMFDEIGKQIYDFYLSYERLALDKDRISVRMKGNIAKDGIKAELTDINGTVIPTQLK